MFQLFDRKAGEVSGIPSNGDDVLFEVVTPDALEVFVSVVMSGCYHPVFGMDFVLSR